MLFLPPPNADPPSITMVIAPSQARAAAWGHIQKKYPAFKLGSVKWGPERADLHNGKNTVRLGLWHWPGNAPPSRFMLWIDASGNVVDIKDTTPHESPEQMGASTSNVEVAWAFTRFQGQLPISIFEHPGKPFATAGPYGTTYEGRNAYPYPWEAQAVTSNHYVFGDTTPYEDRKNQLFSDSAHTPAGEAHAGVETFNRFIYKFFNRWSFDGKGTPMSSIVHAGYEYNNAFYAGGPPEDPGWCNCLYYGDGDYTGPTTAGLSFTNFTDFEVIGHEFSHAITAHTANLEYWAQPGGLNEATSDIFGKAFQFWVDAGFPAQIPTPTELDKWTVGARVLFLNGKNIPFRFFYKPSLDAPLYGGGGKSFDYVESGISDADVHFSSGPLNHWAYIASVGINPAPLDLSSPYLKEGLDYNSDFDSVVKVWYRALTAYLEPNSSYSDAAFAVDKAAIELFGENSRQRASFSAAFVAINAIPRDFAHIWPTITEIDKQSVAPGETVNIYGGGFLNGKAEIDGVPIDTIYHRDDWISVNPTKSGVLTVRNNTGVSQSTRFWVEVAQPPHINNFSLSPGGFRLGETVTLTWDADIGNTSINGEPVLPKGTKTVTLSDTSTFTLVAKNAAGVATWTLTAWFRPFDLNADGVVNILDALEVRAKIPYFGNDKTDLNGNSKTDDADLLLIWKELK